MQADVAFLGDSLHVRRLEASSGDSRRSLLTLGGSVTLADYANPGFDLTLFARHGLGDADFRAYCATRTADFPASASGGKTFQIQNNFTRFGNRHTFNFGGTAERYISENVFFQGAQSVYVYNSLDDFYADANSYLANPNRTFSGVQYDRFQVGYSNIPGQEKPIQPLEVWYAGGYAQDDWVEAWTSLRGA